MRSALTTFARTLCALSGPVLLGAGCSFATLNGYDVVQSDMEVDYEPGPVGLEVASAGGETAWDAGDDFSQASFDRSLESALERDATDYTFVAPGDAEHTVRMGRLDVTPVDGGTRVVGEVEIVDRNGRVTTQLRIEHTVPRGQSVDAQAGETFGARIAHYLENRERYHW